MLPLLPLAAATAGLGALFGPRTGALYNPAYQEQAQAEYNARRYVSTNRRPAKKRKLATQRYVDMKIKNQHELKYGVVAGAGTISYDSPTVDHLTGIAQGDTDSTREGDSINLRRLKINAVLQNADGTTNYGVRFLVIKWKEDSIPSAADVIGPTGGALGSDSFYSNLNHDQRRAYKVLFDSGPVVLGHTSSGSIPQRVPFCIDVPLSGKVLYSGAGSTYGRGALWLIALAETTQASNDSLMEYESMVEYSD